MQQGFKNIRFLIGNQEIMNQMPVIKALPAFSLQALCFFQALSKELLKDREAKEYQDIMAYAFWIRKSSVEREQELHRTDKMRMGRGTAFHIAPSNVPINFAVSMTSALLAGNACIIRISEKEFAQVRIICRAIDRILEECEEMRSYLCIVRYDHDQEITDYLSRICDIRIIWGGNRTIEEIRKSPLPMRAVEMAFPDRYSMLVIDSEEYVRCDPKKAARDFYTDTFYTDQNACSSPRLIVWLGTQAQEAKRRFWKEAANLVREVYEMKPIQAVNKFSSFCLLAAVDETVRLHADDNFIYRIEVSRLSEELMRYKDGSGFFFEYEAETLEEIIPVLGKTCQTVSVLGISKEEIRQLTEDYGVRGVDRIVDIGRTMELSFYWDGYDMIETMSRIIEIG